MTQLGVALLTVCFGAAGIFLAARFYLLHEVEVRGKWILLGLRIVALVVVTLLLLDIPLPGEDPARAASNAGSWVLLDADLSLLVPSPEGGALWDRAVDFADAASESGARIALAAAGADGPEGTEAVALESRVPTHPSGDLLNGIDRLAEAGADSVIVVSSFRRPAGFMDRLVREAPVPVRLQAIGSEGARNAGVWELALPSTVPVGEEVEGRVSVFGERGSPGDTVRVEIRADAVLVAAVALPLPSPGAATSGSFRLPAMADTGLVRVTVEADLSGDEFPIDDLRTRWLRVGEPEGGILLISTSPDWEPRFLLPVLEAVTGLEGEGYLSLGEVGFIPLVATDLGAEDPGSPIVGPERFRDRIPSARLLVVHGAAAALPSDLASAVRVHPRVLLLPTDPEGAALAGIRVTGPADGELAPDAQVPASPVAPFLAGLRLGGLPSIGSVMTPLESPSGEVALAGRGVVPGEAVPLVLLQESEAGRRVVALAQGFWRWGSREGEARQAYRALWGGAANWLLARSDPLGEEGVRPVDLVQPRGEPLRWEVAEAAGEIELRILSLEGGAAGTSLAATEAGGAGGPNPRAAVTGVVFRGTLTADSMGIATTPPLEPGLYRYELYDSGSTSARSEGLVEVERWAPSLRHPPLSFEDSRISAVASGAATATDGRPLRTHPLPYLLVLGLLSAEWLGRRRVGLR